MNTLAFIAVLCAFVGFFMTLGRCVGLRRYGRRYEWELFLTILWFAVLILDLYLTFAVFK